MHHDSIAVALALIMCMFCLTWISWRTTGYDSPTDVAMRDASLEKESKCRCKATEERTFKANVNKCADLGWVCVPIVAESYGAWIREVIWIPFFFGNTVMVHAT